MKDNVVSESTRDLDDALISHPWLYLPLHGPTLGDGNDTSTKAYDRAYVNTNGQTTAILTDGLTEAMSGTTGGIWTDNAGWLTAPGDGFIADTSAAVHDFFEMSTLTSGGLLICFRLQVGADDASGAEYFLTYSDLDADEGGFAILFNTAEKVFVSISDTDDVTTNVCSDTDAMSVDTEYAYCIYLDCKNLEASLYRNGVEGTSDIAAISSALPTLNQAAGLALFARAGATGTNKFNQNGSGGMMRDLLIVRAESDISASIGAIALDYHNSLGDIPRALTSV